MITDHTEPRKPCIALMGEFSAGKSTLANLLIGEDPLPVQIVATRLPPVRISYGTDAPYTVDFEGNKRPIELQHLAEVSLENLTYIQIFSTEDILQHCDLIDMPGISDPNIASDVWDRMIGHADGVLWCSHATQAWRQSEAAVWASLPSELYDRSLLLLTRADKLRSEADRDRVAKRVRKETEGLFRACMPISLLLATQDQDNLEAWSQSGAEDFVGQLVALLEHLNAEIRGEAPQADLRLPGFEGPNHQLASTSQGHSSTAPAPEAPRIVPRRISQTSSETPRPLA